MRALTVFAALLAVIGVAIGVVAGGGTDRGGLGAGSVVEAPTPKGTPSSKPACQRPSGVQDIGFSKTRYPHILRHYETALAAGWPEVLVLNRPGADARRDRLLASYDTEDGYDRDEYPPAIGRGAGPEALTRGSDPVGWMGDVQLVPSSENRSHGSTMGIKLRRFCDGTRFRYRFY